MGKALDELAAVRYLSRWEIQPMATTEGYKFVLWPGHDILQSLNGIPTLTAGGTNPMLDATTETLEPQEFTVEAQEALMALLSLGVASSKANSLIKQCGPNRILDLTEYAVHLANTAPKGKPIGNPAGLLIYWVRNDISVPSSFETSRRRKEIENAKQVRAIEQQQRIEREAAYSRWRDSQLEKELATRYPGDEMGKKINEIVLQRQKTDPLFARVRREQHAILARQILQKEVREQMALPSFEGWAKTNAQASLFGE